MGFFFFFFFFFWWLFSGGIFKKIFWNISAKFEDIKKFLNYSQLEIIFIFRYSGIIDTSYSELESNYRESMRKAFFEAVLSDPENRKILNVKIFKTSFPVFHVQFPVSWHQNVLNGKNFMRHNLFITNASLVQLRDLWFEK